MILDEDIEAGLLQVFERVEYTDKYLLTTEWRQNSTLSDIELFEIEFNVELVSITPPHVLWRWVW